ncbi:hypothetical protein EJB05_31919 [Eragrostis curvula]|uniref:Uncharacterized protein n=1 Tax=Eragrostis curvula TaxID=38414 RepID=A0A5J9UES9_9POAL|nr:hypothetical protein EJB05_31919 [Eragrostis curvula]
MERRGEASGMCEWWQLACEQRTNRPAAAFGPWRSGVRTSYGPGHGSAAMASSYVLAARG